MRDFLDLFNHRLLSVHYRIAQKLHPALHVAPPEKTSLGKALFRFMGIGTEQTKAFPPRDILAYTRFFWKNPHTPPMLRMLIQSYFGCPVEVKPFQGRWFPLARGQQTAIAVTHTPQNNQLGQSAIIGKRAWCQESSLTVCLSLETPEQFADFLPTGTAYPVLKNLIHAYVGTRVSFKIGLKLAQKIPPRLGQTTQAFAFILGWTSWLGKDRQGTRSPWVILPGT
jgi:type VI secretion system protein ImpH